MSAAERLAYARERPVERDPWAPSSRDEDYSERLVPTSVLTPGFALTRTPNPGYGAPGGEEPAYDFALYGPAGVATVLLRTTHGGYTCGANERGLYSRLRCADTRWGRPSGHHAYDPSGRPWEGLFASRHAPLPIYPGELGKHDCDYQPDGALCYCDTFTDAATDIVRAWLRPWEAPRPASLLDYGGGDALALLLRERYTAWLGEGAYAQARGW